MTYRSLSSTGLVYRALICFCTVFMFFFTGCGDSGSGSGGATGLTYSGKETPVALTAENAEELSAGALNLGVAGSTFDNISISQNSSQETVGNQSFLPPFLYILEDTARQVEPGLFEEPSTRAAVRRETDTIEGDCSTGPSGSASYSIQLDDSSGIFSGTLEFSDYCVDETYIDGSTEFSGAIDMQAQELMSFTLSFDMLTGTTGENSFTFDGQVEFVLNTSATTTTMTMLVKNNQTASTQKAVDYRMSVTDYGSYESVEVSGTYYHPDHGYVTLSITDPLLYETWGEYPYAGQVELEGATGSAGSPTTAQLTAVSATHCQVKVDVNGDGDYDDSVDYDSGEMTWEELGN